MRYIVWLVTGFILGILNPALANDNKNSCSVHLSDSASTKAFETLEKNLNQFFVILEPFINETEQNIGNAVYVDYDESTKLIENLENIWLELTGVQDRIRKIEDIILNGNAPSITDLKSISNKLISLKAEYESTKLSLSKLLPMQIEVVHQSTVYDEVIADPTRVIADYKYKVDSPTGTYFIVFTPDIVEEVFLDRRNIPMRIIVRSLNDSKKGLFGGAYEGTGIKRLVGSKEIVEVRSIGKDANFRLFGYITHLNEVHIVHYSESNNHSSAVFYANIINKVEKVKATRGH